MKTCSEIIQFQGVLFCKYNKDDLIICIKSATSSNMEKLHNTVTLTVYILHYVIRCLT